MTLGQMIREMEYPGSFSAKRSDFNTKPNNDVFTFGVWNKSKTHFVDAERVGDSWVGV